MSPPITLSHGGDLGDTLYALPTIRRLAGYDDHGGRAHLVLHAAPGKVREPWTAAKVSRVRGFFEAQPYVASVTYAGRPAGRNMDAWRRRYLHDRNLADMVSVALGVPVWSPTEPWAVVDRVDPVAAVVVHRSPRYHGPFCWAEVADRYRGDLAFVGAEAEHAAFTKEFGFVPYFPTPTLLDLARVLAGCGLFVGNQSAPRAVAEALKVPVWVEECPRTPNTRFARPDAGYGPERVVLG